MAEEKRSWHERLPLYDSSRHLIDELPLAVLLALERKGEAFIIRRRRDNRPVRAYLRVEQLPEDLWSWIAASKGTAFDHERAAYKSGMSWLLKLAVSIDGTFELRRWPGT